ncbi:MAG TPA: DUF1501 domain-containing protein, partial [Planctomycetaceae bacterium]|nr:DUF1501 domain-containing protein [Planctomycetaceae bacterium]
MGWQPPWNGGRGHSGHCCSALVAGGGFKGGHVVGTSDARGEQVEDRPVYPCDLLGSIYEIYELLGIDPDGRLQATLTLYDARGNELACCDGYRFHPDPVLLFELPEDGQYTAEIKDAIYRGRATIDGGDVGHAAVRADAMMQAFASKHLVPAHDFLLALPRRRPSKRPADTRAFRPSLRLLTETPIRIRAGGQAELQAHVTWDSRRGEIEFELSDPPKGIRIAKAWCKDRTATIVLEADATEASVGLRGNLIIGGFQNRTQTNKEGKTRHFRSFLGPLPAAPFETVKRSLR